MNFRLETRLALRYTLGHHRSRLGNFITLISVLGLVLGVSTLITVVSVMNGFDKELRERILMLVPHIRLSQIDMDMRANWQQDALSVQQHPDVVAVSPYSELDVLFRYRGAVEPGLLYALDADIEGNQRADARAFLSLLGPQLLQQLGSTDGLVIGSGLAERLNIRPGARLTTMVYQGAHGQLQARSFEVLGIFHSGTELDQRLSLISFNSLTKIPGQSVNPQGLRVQINSIFDARSVGRQIQNSLPLGYQLATWQRTHGNLYEAIQMSRYLVALIVLLILAVAAFNLVATLMITSADKQSDIAVLKTLGAEPGSLSRIFALQGLFIGILGSILGAIVGVLLSLNLTGITGFVERSLGVQLLNTQVYPLDYLPSYLDWQQLALVVFVAVSLSVLAALYPAWKVAKVEPAQVLRYQ